MWVKPTSEMSFLYGNHLLKSGLGRITENTPANQGRNFSMSDVPLGFGVAAKSTQDCRKLDPSARCIPPGGRGRISSCGG